MVQTNHWDNKKNLTHNDLVILLKQKIAQINFNQAKEDVLPFLKNPDSVLLWSNDFFLQLLDKLKSIYSSEKH